MSFGVGLGQLVGKHSALSSWSLSEAQVLVGSQSLDGDARSWLSDFKWGGAAAQSGMLGFQ